MFFYLFPPVSTLFSMVAGLMNKLVVRIEPILVVVVVVIVVSIALLVASIVLQRLIVRLGSLGDLPKPIFNCRIELLDVFAVCLLINQKEKIQKTH